jgi:hypothetical protein
LPHQLQNQHPFANLLPHIGLSILGWELTLKLTFVRQATVKLTAPPIYFTSPTINQYVCATIGFTATGNSPVFQFKRSWK